MEELRKNVYYNDLALRAVHDMAAFDELYNYYFPRVYNFLFARLKDAAAADDVISEVFFKVYKHLADYDCKKGSFSTWLFRIAVNQVTDYFRRQQRRKEDTWEDFFAPALPEQEQPEAKALAAEGSKELLTALEKLKERERRVIELKYWADLSNKEIAEVMGISPGNVGVILFRAIGNLKKHVKPE